MKREIHHFESAIALCEEAAQQVRKRACAVAKEGRRFTLALSGGTTPRPLYERLSTTPDEIPWEQVHLFWADERCVPPDHPANNFRMAYESLIAYIPIPPENVHRIRAEAEPSETAALLYEEELRRTFRDRDHFRVAGFRQIPQFDLVLLGMGDDGHTASLFPGSKSVHEESRWAIPVLAPETVEPRERITLALPIINNAREALFLVAGRGKKKVLDAILDETQESKERYPAARVFPRGTLLWFIAEA